MTEQQQQRLNEIERILEQREQEFAVDGLTDDERAQLARMREQIRQYREDCEVDGRGSDAAPEGDAEVAAPVSDLDEDQRRAIIDETMERCADLQNDIHFLEGQYSDETHYVRVQLEEHGYIDQLNQIVEQLQALTDSGGEVPASINDRLDEISRELGRLLNHREPRTPEADPSPEAAPPESGAEPEAPAPSESTTEFPECCRTTLSVIRTQVSALQAADHVARELAPHLTRAVTVEDMAVAGAIRIAQASATEILAADFAEALQALPHAQLRRQILGHLTHHEARHEQELAGYWREVANAFGYGG